MVDAGAQGFIHFLEGMLHFIQGDGPADTAVPSPVIEDSPREIPDQEVTNRYCTELFLKGRDMDPVKIRQMLEPLGDSVLVGGNTEKIHVHLHTQDPAEAAERLRPFGTITRQKIDDMKRQYEARYQRRARIALVTDSSCDLPEEILDEYQIHLIPLNLAFGENVYLDKLSIRSRRFYELLDEEPVFPTTSQPSVKQIEILYRDLAASYDSIISVHLSDALSGTCNTARQAAARVSEAKISVIDSKTLSTSLGLIVLNAAREIMNGSPHDEVVRKIGTWTQKVKILVSVRTLKYMVRGGRVSPLKGKIAGWLNLKPIVSLDAEGRSALTGKAFSTRSNLQK
ncbi:MAG TPA: DegV family protein, partial [bacterium]|nr:DegV family protein [bacterium]